MPVNISIFLCAGQQFFRWEITMAQYYKMKNKKGMIRLEIGNICNGFLKSKSDLD